MKSGLPARRYVNESCTSELGSQVTYAIPESLDTPRLHLRRFREDDWHDLVDYYCDAECMRYTNGRALTHGECWRNMALMVGHWELRSWGPYAIVDRASDRVLGPVGLWYPVEWPEPEIKWGLAKAAWGKGLAFEAAVAVRDLAAACLSNLHLVSVIHRDNEGSLRLAERLGATFEREIEVRGSPCRVYRHTAPLEPAELERH